MKCIATRMMIGVFLALAAAAAAGAMDFEEPRRETPQQFRVLPLDKVNAFVNDWSDASMPHYAIITNPAEWQATFSALPNMGDGKLFQPNPSIYQQAALVSISRMSEAPPQGHPVLFVKSFGLVDGEAILTYGFYPPESRGGRQVKNTMLVAVPLRFLDGIRIVEEEESAASMATGRELDAARAAGRVKRSERH